MSTKPKNGRKKRSFLTVDRIRIIEYICIGLVVLLFVGLAIRYGTKTKDAPESVEPAPEPPIRGELVLDALAQGGYTVVPDPDGYDVTAPDGVRFRMEMQSDSDGIRLLTFRTELCADPEDDLDVSAKVREQNARTVASLRDLFDRVMKVYQLPAADSDLIVKQCRSVVSDGETFSKRLGGFTVRVESDPNAAPQTVSVSLIRD